MSPPFARHRTHETPINSPLAIERYPNETTFKPLFHVNYSSCFHFTSSNSGSRKREPDFRYPADTSAWNSSGGSKSSAQTVEHPNDSHRYAQDEPEELG